ncbi:MAG: FimV/HubP family polar landmark protein [Paraperlucidibaca sp.]
MRHGLQYAAFVALGLILTTPALAVSVGDIRPQSRVGEPLVVKITIIDSDGIADDSIQIMPATAADHALLGMQRPVWLDQMVFSTERDANGQLQVRGQAPIVPPSSEQNFLVQLSWPGHVRLQQISISLPAAGSAPAAAAIDPALAQGPATVSLPTPVNEQLTTVIPAQPATNALATTAAVNPVTAGASTVIPTQPTLSAAVPAPIVERPAQTRSGPISVRNGDTLSQIASEWDQNLSLNQRQQIIRERNPQAFINGSINLLRADVRIDLPDPSSVTVPSERAADRWYSQALKQATGLLNADLKKPVVASSTADSNDATTEPNLTLVAPGQGDGGAAGAGKVAGNDAVSSALAEAETERASLLAKRLQLRERLAKLNESTADADQRLQVLDERLAAMARGETPTPDEATDSASQPADNAWLWWLAAGLFWLLLLVVWLRQRAQRQQAEHADHDNTRQEPIMAAAATNTPVGAKAHASETAETEFDDTFASLAPESTSLGSYAVTDDAAHDDEAEEEYDFLSDSDAEAYQTRLDLAQAYLDMNEDDAARQLLDRVVEGGTSEQKARAKALIDQLG